MYVSFIITLHEHFLQVSAILTRSDFPIAGAENPRFRSPCPGVNPIGPGGIAKGPALPRSQSPKTKLGLAAKHLVLSFHNLTYS